MRKAHVAVIVSLLGWAPHAPAQKAKHPPSLPPRLYHNVHALCVGINTFPNLTRKAGQDPTLATPEQTAKALAKILSKRYGYKTKTLVGPVTKSTFEEAFAQYRMLLGPDDALIVFVATHGASVEVPETGFQGFLVPQDARLDLSDTADYEAWKRQAISMRWLGDQCEKMKARHVLILLEACFSGYLGTMGESGELLRSYEILATTKSRAAITGGTRDQQLRDGVFGSSVIDTLNKLDRALTARELHLLVRDKVMARIGEAMKPQYREMLLDHGEFVFVPLDVSPAKLPEQIQESNATVAKFMGDQVTMEDLIAAAEAEDPRFTSDAPIRGRQWQSRIARLERHAEAGNPIAMAALFYCYNKGLGTAKDPSKAFFWAQETFDTGHVAGKHVLGKCYAAGIGVNQNKLVSSTMFSEAAEMGFPLSRYILCTKSVRKVNDQGVALSETQQKKLDRWTRELSELHFASAKVLRAFLVGYGVGGISQDVAHGVRLMREAAELGLPRGNWELGRIYLTGVPGIVDIDKPKARQLMLQAAEDGCAEAQWFVGSCYVNQRWGFPKDCEKGSQFIGLSISQGNTSGMGALAGMYEEGICVRADPSKALPLLERAAELGDMAAYASASVYYWNGTVVERDDDRAYRYALRAAEANDPLGCYMVAECYYRLRGVPGIKTSDPQTYAQSRKPQLHHALYWYIRAAEGGKEKAIERIIYFMFPDGKATTVLQSEESKQRWEQAWHENPLDSTHYGYVWVLERLDEQYPGMKQRLKALADK